VKIHRKKKERKKGWFASICNLSYELDEVPPKFNFFGQRANLIGSSLKKKESMETHWELKGNIVGKHWENPFFSKFLKVA